MLYVSPWLVANPTTIIPAGSDGKLTGVPGWSDLTLPSAASKREFSPPRRTLSCWQRLDAIWPNEFCGVGVGRGAVRSAVARAAEAHHTFDICLSSIAFAKHLLTMGYLQLASRRAWGGGRVSRKRARGEVFAGYGKKEAHLDLVVPQVALLLVDDEDNEVRKGWGRPVDPQVFDDVFDGVRRRRADIA